MISNITTETSLFQRIALTGACAALLANSRFFNEQLSRTAGTLAASFVSHSVGLLFLIAAILVRRRWARAAATTLVATQATRSLRHFSLLVLSSATFSIGVVFFANATAVEVHASAAIPLFLAFIVFFSIVIEAVRSELTAKRLGLAGISLLVSLIFLAVQRQMLTPKGILLGAAAALSLTASRTSLRRLSEASTPLTSCLLVHGVLGAIGFAIMALRPDFLVQAPPSAYLGGALGAAFQFLLVITLQRHGDLVSNTLIQTQQVLFGYLTSFYSMGK